MSEEQSPNPLFYDLTIKETICAHLSFEDAVSWRDYLGLDELQCPIPITTRKREKVVLPGVNPLTIRTYNLLKDFGLDRVISKAIRRDDLEMFSLLLKLSGITLTNTSMMHYYLMTAARKGANKIIKFLFEVGVDLNNSTATRYTALMMAIAYDRISTVKLLIELGANVNKPNSSSDTPLIIAIRNKLPKMVALLLKAGADPNLRDNRNWTPLVHAAFARNLKTAELLIAAGADVHARIGEEDDTILATAWSIGAYQIFGLVGEHGGVME